MDTLLMLRDDLPLPNFYAAGLAMAGAPLLVGGGSIMSVSGLEEIMLVIGFILFLLAATSAIPGRRLTLAVLERLVSERWMPKLGRAAGGPILVILLIVGYLNRLSSIDAPAVSL